MPVNFQPLRIGGASSAQASEPFCIVKTEEWENGTVANAAQQLLQLLEQWAVPNGKTPEGVRGGVKPANVQFWRNNNRAVQLVAEVDRYLSERAAAGHELRGGDALIRSCYSAVYGFSPVWGTPGGNAGMSLLSETDFSMLQLIGQLMDATGGAIRPSDQVIEDIRDSLNELEEVVEGLRENPEDTTAEMRGYLAVLIAEAWSAIEEFEATGFLPLRSRITELGGLVVTITLSGAVRDPSVRKRLGRIGFGLLANVAGNVAAGGVLEAGESIAGAIG